MSVFLPGGGFSARKSGILDPDKIYPFFIERMGAVIYTDDDFEINIRKVG